MVILKYLFPDFLRRIYKLNFVGTELHGTGLDVTVLWARRDVTWQLSLTLSTLGKFFSRLHFEIFFFLYPENWIWHFMQIVSMETICMKCQILFWGKNKKSITTLSSTEYAQRVVKVKHSFLWEGFFFGGVGGGGGCERCWCSLLLKGKWKIFILGCFLLEIYSVILTHLCLASHKWDISKQCRPRSDAADRGVWSGSTRFALTTGISIKHGYNQNWPDTP